MYDKNASCWGRSPDPKYGAARGLGRGSGAQEDLREDQTPGDFHAAAGRSCAGSAPAMRPEDPLQLRTRRAQARPGGPESRDRSGALPEIRRRTVRGLGRGSGAQGDLRRDQTPGDLHAAAGRSRPGSAPAMRPGDPLQLRTRCRKWSKSDRLFLRIM